jgi:hypothetical protein
MKNLRPQNISAQEGMALVIVLSVLVLLTIMVVGFLSRATIDRTSASAYSDGDRNSLLSDYAVNIVQAQIDHASTRTNAAWASQPGMVRTFAQDGTLLQAYKLYSDAGMATNAVDLSAATNAMAGWGNSTAHFVDLNEPVEIESRKEYPIIDPSALDKKPDASPMIEGFEVTNAPGTTSRQPIPMPVRWLYVLEDGQTVAPSNASGTTATMPLDDKGAPIATKSNPIVGRIAFWTDDETCKLNINTASHGMFWDIPRAFSLDERDRMARFQPALREFQRYPGHPASTSLSPVLGYKVSDPKDFGSFIYNLTPRIQQGGSEGGTKFASATPVTLDSDRLYVSLDELLFSATAGIRAPQTGLDRSDIERSKFFLTARSNSPEVNLFNLPRMAIWPINAGTKTPSTLDKLIARSATINGKPYFFQRSDPASPTADMALDDGRNQKLYDYINALLAKPFPGFGTRLFVDKYTTAETAQITTSIFDYIRSSNLYSTALGATSYTGTNATTAGSRLGQTTPLQIGDTKGFGRLPTISQAVFHLYVSGLRSTTPNPVPGQPDIVREFPSTDYPMQTGKPPYYSDDFSSGSYKSIRDLLTATGAGNPVDLLTSGIIYFDTFDPNLGYAKPRYKFDIEVAFSGGWTVNDKSLGFQDATLNITRDQEYSPYNSKINSWTSTYYGRFYGGQLGPLWLMQNFTYVKGNPVNAVGSFAKEYPLASRRVALGQTATLSQEDELNPYLDPPANTQPYLLWLDPPANTQPKITLPKSTDVSFGNAVFSGGTVTATIKIDGTVIQTFTFDFPAFTKEAPNIPPRDYLPTLNYPIDPTKPPRSLPYTGADLVLKQLATSADFRHRWAQQPNTHVKYAGVGTRMNALGEFDPPKVPAPIPKPGSDLCDLWLIQSMDTMVALEPAFGDKRILAARPTLKAGLYGDPAANFVPNKDYFSPSVKIAADFRNDPWAMDRRARAVSTVTRPGRILDITYGRNAMPDVPSRYSKGVKTTTDGNFWPDFDNGTLTQPDDAYVNRADEGSIVTTIDDALVGGATGDRGFSWYSEGATSANNPSFFSPNKQMPSAGMFGSIPTGAVRNKPWQTLLFRPDPGNHPGAQSPPDYVLLDLFWMPVVEPYAISEPFSTNGKVNMNYQIMPFGGYLHRSTALRGVLQTQELVILPNSLAYTGTANATTGYAGKSDNGTTDDEYKKYAAGTNVLSFSTNSTRSTLNPSRTTGTLRTFEDLFAKNEIFRSETQICSVPLISANATWSADFEKNYWDSPLEPRRLAGDNSREMPYTQLLPRLTTRSNTYTVHYRVQNLKKVPSTDPDVWNEGKDKVTSELRGSRTIERYLDPNDARIPDYAADPTATPTLDAFYRWRTLYNRTFAP